jgi:hypothetical protein
MAGIVTLCIVAYAGLYTIRSMACDTITKKRTADAMGDAIEVTYANCDTLAKEEFVSVYISKAANKSFPFTKWFQKKTVVFRYDPHGSDGDTDDFPRIENKGPNKILISVPDVSSIFVETRRWGNLTLDYDIGHVDYSEATPSMP